MNKRINRALNHLWAPWYAWVSVLLTAAGGTAILWGGEFLTPPQQAAIWGLLWLFPLACWRRAWLGPFNAVLLSEIVSTARKGRFALLRCLYSGALLLLLLLMYWEQFIGPEGQLGTLWSGGIVAVNDEFALSEINRTFALLLLKGQFAAVVVLTPACAAGAIAQERDRNTWDLLLTSDLSNYEIVVGKLAARLAYVLMIVLTGLPLLSLLQLLGGINPDLVMSGFAITLFTIVGLAALSLLNSLYAWKPGAAILRTYLQAGAYLALSNLLPSWLDMSGGDSPILRWITSGDILTTINRLSALRIPLGGQGWQQARLAMLAVVLEYGAFHAVLALVCLAWVCGRLRAASGKQRAAGFSPRLVWLRSRRLLPAVGNLPMLWKEFYFGPSLQHRYLKQPLGLVTASVVAGTMAVAYFTPFDFIPARFCGGMDTTAFNGVVRAAGMLAFCLFLRSYHLLDLVALGALISAAAIVVIAIQIELFTGEPLPGEMESMLNRIVRLFGTPVACLLLVGVAVRAALSLSGERERNTLSGLLATPVNNRDILTAKWLGSLLWVRRGWWLLVAVWVIGLAGGGLHLWALVELILALAVYAAFLASLGLYLSLTSKTAGRAMVATLLIGAAVGLNPWLMEHFGMSTFIGEAGPASAERPLTSGLSPPVSLYELAFCRRDLDEDWARNQLARYGSSPRGWHGRVTPGSYSEPEIWSRLTRPLPGLVCYLVLAVLFAGLTGLRFARITSRMPFGVARRSLDLLARGPSLHECSPDDAVALEMRQAASSLPSSRAARTVERDDSLLSEANP